MASCCLVELPKHIENLDLKIEDKLTLYRAEKDEEEAIEEMVEEEVVNEVLEGECNNNNTETYTDCDNGDTDIDTDIDTDTDSDDDDDERPKLSITIDTKPSSVDNIKLKEIVPKELIDKLLNSTLLKEDVNVISKKFFSNERQQLEKYKSLNNGKLENNERIITYKKPYIKYSRSYPNKALGLIGFSKELRHTLVSDTYIDIDIVNCHPIMLYQILNDNGVSCDKLKDYILNRDIWIKEVMETYNCSRDEAKELFIILLYGGSFKTWIKEKKISKDFKETSNIIEFSKELVRVSRYIVSKNKHIEKVVLKNINSKCDEKEKQKELRKLNSKVVSHFLQEMECRVIEVVYNYCVSKGYIINNVCSLCYDGIMLQKHLVNDVGKLCQELNDEVKKKMGFDLKFIEKKMDMGYSLQEINENQLSREEINEIKVENYKTIKEKYDAVFEDGFKINTSGTDAYMAKLFKKVCFNGDLILYTGKQKDPTGYKFNGVYWEEMSLSNCDLMKDNFDNLEKYLSKKLFMLNDIFKSFNPFDVNSTELYETIKKEIIFLSQLIVKCGRCNDRCNIIKMFKSECFIDNVEWDEKPYFFVFKNKIFNFETMDWIEPSPSQYIKTTTGYDYEEPSNEDIEFITKIIYQILPSKDVRDDYLITLATGMVGFLIQKFNIASGVGGNGKSVINTFFLKMVGNYGYKLSSSVLLQQLKQGPNPELANLHKKRFVLSSEPDAKQRIKSSIIKELTGSNDYNARKLYSDACDVILQLTLFLECNSMPKMDEVIDAVLRRLRATNFSSVFVSQEIYDSLTEEQRGKNVFVGKSYYTENAFYNKYKCALFKFMLPYLKVFLDNNKDLQEQPFKSRQLVSAYLGVSDDIYSWFKDEYCKLNEEELNTEIDKPISIKEIFETFKASSFYENLSKNDKRNYNFAKFKELLHTNLFLKLFFMERDKYYNGIRVKKPSIVGWKLRNPDDENESDCDD